MGARGRWKSEKGEETVGEQSRLIGFKVRRVLWEYAVVIPILITR